jgi:hypothetical protein
MHRVIAMMFGFELLMLVFELNYVIGIERKREDLLHLALIYEDPLHTLLGDGCFVFLHMDIL